MRKYIKKLLVITLIILSCALTSCFKKDTLGFISGEYKYTLNELVCSFDGAVLEDMSLKVIEIDRETYIQHDKTCVLENRYSNKCYSISLHMQIDGILYNDFEIYDYGTIKFAGAASTEKTLTPYIGQIVGYIDSTTTYSSCGCYGDSDQGNLTKVGGFLGIGRTDQAMYVSDEECGYEA